MSNIIPIRPGVDIRPRVTPSGHRPLCDIASDIFYDWRDSIPPNAAAYLVPMLSLYDITDNFLCDSASYVVRYFLANAQGWRGDTARAIKAELKQILETFDNTPEQIEQSNKNVTDFYNGDKQ